MPQLLRRLILLLSSPPRAFSSAPPRTFSNNYSNPKVVSYLEEEEEDTPVEFWPSLKKHNSDDYIVPSSSSAAVSKLDSKSELVKEAVVSVSCEIYEADATMPWACETSFSQGSGFILDGRRVLTYALRGDKFKDLQLKRHNLDTYYPATVLVNAPDCGIAMLTVDDDEFWEGVEPIKFGDIPRVGDEIMIMGYANGKDPNLEHTINVTRYHFPSVGMLRCSHLRTQLLALEVNVPLEKGYSGGPAFNKNGKCMGMVFRDAYGYAAIISTPMIKHFIRDFDRNGMYTGFPSLGILWQTMENPDLRMSMNMKSDQQGILVTKVKPYYPESNILNQDDIILSIDGINVGNDGTVPITRGQRIDFSYLLTRKYMDEEIDIKVLRNSEVYEFTIKLGKGKQLSVRDMFRRRSSYYIVGEYVFIPYSLRYLQDWDSEIFKNVELDEWSNAFSEEQVVIGKVYKYDDSSDKYKSYHTEMQQILSLNGKPIKSLKELVKIIEACSDEFLQFALGSKKVLVLQTESARAKIPGILQKYKIPSVMSDDLKELSVNP